MLLKQPHQWSAVDPEHNTLQVVTPKTLAAETLKHDNQMPPESGRHDKQLGMTTLDTNRC